MSNSSPFEFLPIVIAIVYTLWQWLTSAKKKKEKNNWDVYLDPNKTSSISIKDEDVEIINNQFVDKEEQKLNEKIVNTTLLKEEISINHSEAYSLEKKEIKKSSLNNIIDKYPTKKASVILHEILSKKIS